MAAPQTQSTPSAWTPVRRRVLVTVAAAVLLAHVGLLAWAPPGLRVIPPSAPADTSKDTLHFDTRRIDPAPTAQPDAAPRPTRPASVAQRARAPSAGVPAAAPAAALPVQDQAPSAPPEEAPVPAPADASTPALPPAAEALASASAPAPEPTSLPTEAPYDPSLYRFVPPPSVRLSYEVQLQVKGFKQSATAEMRWALEGNNYNARLEVRHWLAGARVQTSTGQITAQGLAPTRFSDKVRNEVAAHFERDKALVTFSANTPSAPLLPGMQDRLSVFIQLAALLAGASPSLPAGTELLVPVAGPRSADLWRLTLQGDESLPLPGGVLNATKWTRLPQKEYDQKLELWLAPSMGFLPVRIRLTDANGDVADQLWQASQ